ncbi:site-2 protease family protein [Halorientalis salina]|uniref:site-2 protease family protein n=1 Tax=Halorientalis salina TaxID=2932266 RepID=UPI0010ABDF9B|nr:site-2 protease family protein [Halorientalis salina]
MVRTLTWVLAGVLLYTLVAMALRARGRIPEYIRVQGPITTIHTKRGRAFLDWLASPRRLWRAWGNFGVGIALVTMIGMFVTVLFAGVRSVTEPQATPVRNPQNVLVIPGVNDFLPVAAAPEIVFGLVAGLIVHEGGHGLLCRVEDIDIDSMGLALFAFIPIGAFVEPSEESRNEANRGAQTRMFAAGVTNNFAITLVAFLLLFGPIAGAISVVDGAPVGKSFPGSAAQDAGIERGDVITGVGGQPVANASELDAVLENTTDRTVEVERREGSTVRVDRKLMITRAIPGVLDGWPGESGVDISGDTPPTITAVNGTPVYTEQGFSEAVQNRPVATVSTTAGNATFPVGAYVTRASEGDPLAAAGAPTNGTAVVITQFGGERITDTGALQTALSSHEPGDEVTIEAYVLDGERPRATTYNVTLTEDDDGSAYLGVFLQGGTSGVAVNDFGIDTYPAEGFLGLLGGGNGPAGESIGFIQQIFFVLVLPFASVIVPNLSYNFAGFLPSVVGFYTIEGPLSVFGGWVFTLANVMFWTAWINLQLGLFNLVPSFPLDGGHILRASTEALISRLPIEGGRRLTTAVTISISLVMIAGLFLMIFGPGLLAGMGS